MWQLKNLKTQKSELDFSYSGQSSFLTTQLWADDIQLINMIEHVNWGESPLQFIICADCGFLGCEPGNWVEIKRAGKLALIMPAFAKIRENDKYLYSPPYYLFARGVIYVEQEFYTNQLCQIADFPAFETLALLNAWEAVEIFKLEYPNRIWGNILDPLELSCDIVIASSEGDYKEQAKEINSLVDLLATNTQSAKLRRVTEQDQIISLYLDVAGVPEWKALSYNGSRYSLYLEPRYVIE